MSKYLAGRAGAKDKWTEVRVVAYLNQHVLKTTGSARGQPVGIRDARELRTLAEMIDALGDRDYDRVGDLAMQRFQAVEYSIADGGWGTARHLEVVPATDAVAAPQKMLELAAKAETRRLQLVEASHRAKQRG